jgi:ABC-type transport system involved in multi-copper enzyme maturation permease subunit
MTADATDAALTPAAQPATEPAAQPAAEPTALQTFWASLTAVVTKESRWRMRGRRAFVIMTVYVLVLALLVLAVYRMMYDRAVFDATMQGNGGLDSVSGSLSVLIGQSIFTTILIVQTILTLMLAPGLTSGSISMEREKQTLDLLITTPVSTLGMVIGKLVSSLAFVFLLVLASVPLMSAVFVFGGIAPDDIVRAYVLLFACTFGIGSIGLFVSAVFKRTQVAGAVAYVIAFLLAIGTIALHSYIYASSQPVGRFGAGVDERHAPEALLWLNPFVADLDVLCTAIPESYGFTCSYIAGVSGRNPDFREVAADPPRDAFWPKSVAAFLVLGVALTLLTTQYIAPSRRIRRRRGRQAPPAGADDSVPSA